jgi:hypothetical protein
MIAQQLKQWKLHGLKYEQKQRGFTQQVFTVVKSLQQRGRI